MALCCGVACGEICTMVVRDRQTLGSPWGLAGETKFGKVKWNARNGREKEVMIKGHDSSNTAKDGGSSKRTEGIDVLDSKIKKLRIELPHYSSSHSSSGESSHSFVGRKQILKKLERLIEAAADKTGVYLVTGNRGVGKTRLVNQVINQTSLQSGSDFYKNLKYIFMLLFSVAVIQFCSQEFNVHFITFVIIFLLFLFLLCCYNGDRYNIPKQKCKILKVICDSIASAFKELTFLINPYNPYRKRLYLLKIILVVCGTQIFSLIPCITPTIVFLIYLLPILGFTFCRKWHKCKNIDKSLKFREFILSPIKKYIISYNRLYLRINFGHKLKDEKDILRLITRTLSTEYHKYLNSFLRLFLWRGIAFSSLLLMAHLFSGIVEKQELYNKLIKETVLYKASSQASLNGSIYIKNKEHLLFTNEEYIKTHKAETFLLALDQLVFDISKRVKKLPQYLFCKDKEIDFDKEFISPINYLFWASFFSIYLFCVLLFHSSLIEYFFVTHRIVKRKLKRLNIDITYSTERENSIKIKNEGIGIGTRIKKMRSIADAREIEKELQDILNKVHQIPTFMCRPDFVIVFDELDKVEPDETNLKNEIQRTKASLFSIDTTRERQMEILKILSNMKYFLSTAEAKFIFIAGREMYDIYLADVSDRNNYIGSIFNDVIYVPSFLTNDLEENNTDMTSLTEEFVCQKLLPHDHLPHDRYDLAAYRAYLEKDIYEIAKNDEINQQIHKIIAVLQQFIIYLAHVSKGAPKKMMQLFDSFIEVCEFYKKEENESLVVQRYHSSRFFLTFGYYKQYTLGIIAYLITPIFNRLSESNIKVHSDKLLVSSLRFVDFLFKFHKHPFSWKHLEISPEMLEVNHAPELKSVAVDLLNYLTQVHINKSSFSFSDYRFDNLIANEIFTMTKTDEVFSALFSFSLDETLPLKKHYQDLLEKTQKEYQNKESYPRFINAISSLQVTLGDLHYYDDELEEASVCYKNAVHALRNLEQRKYEYDKENKATKKDGIKDEDYETMTLEQLYLYVRNMLRLGMIYEKRKQYDFAYMTYGELCKRVIRERNIEIEELRSGIVLRKDMNNDNKVAFVKASKIGKINRVEHLYNDNIEIPEYTGTIPRTIASPQPLYFREISPNTNDMLFKKMTFEGLKMVYLPFIAKLQILEKSHMGGITRNHLEHLDKEFEFLTYVIDHKEAKLLEADFYSHVADILYYKNSDLKCKENGNRKDDDDEDKNNSSDSKKNTKNNDGDKNSSCTACYYYHKALSILLNLNKTEKKEREENTVIKLLSASVKKLGDYCNMKYCTTLARILSDWGNVFFSCDEDKSICDIKEHNTQQDCCKNACYICDAKNCNTPRTDDLGANLAKYINYVEAEKGNSEVLLKAFDELEDNFTKMEIAFAMYSISLKAYSKAYLYKRSAYQMFKMLRLFKYYKIYDYIDKLGSKAISSLWRAAEDLNMLELNKRRKDFDKETIMEEIPLQSLLVDSEIRIIRILIKDLELKSSKSTEKLRKYYGLYITSPYGINYSIVAHIYQLRLKSIVNYEAYIKLVYDEYENSNDNEKRKILEKKLDDFEKNKYKQSGIKIILDNEIHNKNAKEIFGEYFDFGNSVEEEYITKVKIFEKLIAETIFCLKEIIRLSKTIGETYLFNHTFMASIHERLTFWVQLHEAWGYLYKKEYEEKYKKKYKFSSKIGEYLKWHLGEEWREQLSSYYEKQQALSHYYKCLETHNEGKAYHDMIDNICYLKDDYNDRSDHFNIAEERHNILNKKIHSKIELLKELYEKSKLYKADSYFEKDRE
jgi:hypothetical protein